MRLTLIALVLAALAAVAPAHAQTPQQENWCENKGGPSPDMRIGACTAVIQSGKWSGKDLAWAFIGRGTAHRHNKDYDRSIADYSQAIRLDPKSAGAFTGRGNAYYNKKDYAQAIADHSEAIRLDPKYALAYSNRGNAYDDLKDYDRAIADYTEAIRLDPGFTDAIFNRALTYERKGDRERAIVDYRKARSLGDAEAADKLRKLGVTP